MNRELAYVYSYLSFLMPKLKKGSVRNIVLFGSLTRNELSKDSDIDIFVDIYNESEKESVRDCADSALLQFLKSDVFRAWKLRGITNEIKPLVGVLNEQSDLKRSLISNGIVLYGKYAEPIKGRPYALFTINPIEDKKKRYRLFRRLFGRREKNISSKGLVRELGGELLSTRVFIIPVEQAPLILALLKKEKAVYFMKELVSD